MATNLFSRLFTYRPREGLSPKENFLTEAFAEALSNDAVLLRSFLEHLLPGVSSDLAAMNSTVPIETQVGYADGAGGRLIADMAISLRLPSGTSWLIVFEHKWDSPIDLEQLARYGRALKSPDYRLLVVAICPDAAQRADAAGVVAKAMLWEEVHSIIESQGSTEVATHLAAFMQEVGLGRQQPLSVGLMAAYRYGESAPNACKRVLQRLLEPPYDWAFLPDRLRGDRTLESLRYGRVIICFGRTYRPAIQVGFVLDASDIGIALTTEDRGFDLMFALCGSTRGERIRGTAVVEKAIQFRDAFPTARAAALQEIPNRWFSLYVRKSAGEVIAGARSADEQAAAVYECLKAWSDFLFDGGDLLADIERTWPSARPAHPSLAPDGGPEQ